MFNSIVKKVGLLTAISMFVFVSSFITTVAYAQQATATQTIWLSTANPGVIADPDVTAVELGLRFKSAVSGYISGIRFYKAATNTGTHTAKLWSSGGKLLTTATFTGETASGWQQVNFAKPITVTAGTTYVASYHADKGHYSIDDYYFQSGQYKSGNLTAIKGVYKYGSSAFPNQTYLYSNYWVDVVFSPTVVTTYTLTVNAANGSVVKNPNQTSYSAGSTVTLTATPASGYQFSSWSGDATGTTNTATVTMNANKTVTANFTLIPPVNHPPVLAAIGNKTITAGQALSFILSATDADNDVLTYSATGLPTGATFNAATKAFNWTPSTAGAYNNIIFAVNDGKGGTDSEAITITVNDVNRAPVANAQTLSVNQNATLNIALTATDADSDALTYAIVTQPAHGSLSGTGASRIYTPTAIYSGADSFTFKANDGKVDSNIATISITVNAVSVAPSITTQPQAQTVNVGQNAAFSVTATGTAPLSYQWQKNNINISGATSATYTTPVTTINDNGATFKVIVTNSVGSVTSNSVVLTVTALNQAPSVNAGSDLTITLPATASLNGAVIDDGLPNPPAACVDAWSKVSGPGTVTFGNATLVGTAATFSQAGIYQLRLTANDSVLSASDDVIVTVNPAVNHVPVLATIGNKTVTVSQALTFTLSATDADNDILTYSATGLPTGASFNASTETFNWTPSAAGTYNNITFNVNDGKGGTDSEAISITVTAANIINVVPTDSAAVNYGKIEAAGAGDTVLIAPGTYKFRLILNKSGTAAQPITIKAQDPNNRPVFDYSGSTTASLPSSSPSYEVKGGWVFTGSYYTIDGIIINGCHDDGSEFASGMRLLDGTNNLTFRHILVKNSQLGLFVAYGANQHDIIVEYSEFYNNGNGGSNNHNIYVSGGKDFTLRYSYLHDSYGGQNLHCRALTSVIEYNWFEHAADYEIDLMQLDPAGAGKTYNILIMGNVFVPNGVQKVMTIGNDSGSSPIATSYDNVTWIANTIYVPQILLRSIIQISNDSGGNLGSNVIFTNNIVASKTQGSVAQPIFENVVGVPATFTGSNNWIQTGYTNAGSLTGTITGPNPGFTNAGAEDFSLISTSPAIGKAGVLSAENTPTMEYVKHLMSQPRASAKDIGAYEHSGTVTTYTLTVTATNGTVTKNPNNASYNSGDVVTLTATPASNYQFSSWGGDLSGATNPQIITINANKAVTANFTAIPANQPPTITTQPVSASVIVGQTATFTAAATGTAPLSYQWQQDGANIAGATVTTFTTLITVLSDSGKKYQVVVTNPYGSATSNIATLTVSVPPPDLVAYWKMEGNANDSSGSNNGSANAMTFVAVSGQTGASGQAASFNGSNSAITVPDNITLDLSDNFTYAAWVKRSATGNWQSLYDSGTSNGRWIIQFDDTGNHLDYFIAGGSNEHDYLSSGSISDTANWHHVAITKSGSTVTFYIDGVAAGTATISGASIPSGAKKIGYDNYSGSGSYFSGLMDEVRIYNRVLTVQEIATLAVLPPKLNIINPQAGSMVTGTTVVASYNASGDLTTVAKVVLQLDTNPQITLANLSGTSQFNNLAEGQHTLQGYLMKSDSSKITGSDISISFGTQLSDTTPPATPKGLNATSADKQVILTWTNNSETDLAGYNVYRCASAAGTYTKLNASLLTNATYTDTGLTNGTTYYYEITALDTAGNESAKAAAVNTVPAVNTGNVYYVSTSGSDTANGSATAPWQTLQYAAGKVGADDTVMVLPGTYAGMNLVGSSYGGASEHPVTFIANTGDYRTSGVLINTFASSDSTHNAAINIESTKGYFIIKGFTVTASGTQKAGIRVAANPGCQILNNEVYKTFTGIFASIADGVVVQGNKSHDNDGQHGIYVNGTNGYAIRNNECYNNVNDGIHTNVCDGGNLINTNGTIEGNLVYGNAISGFDITGCSNCTFQNNISYGNVTHGIVLQNTNQNPTPNCHDNLLVNNIFIGNLSNTSAYGIHTGTVDNYTNAILFNNIAIGATANNGIESAILSAPGVKLSNNITTNSSSLFVSSTDYHSKSTSPAIDAGVASFNSKSAPVTDKDGVVRPQGGTFDIGAYEYK